MRNLEPKRVDEKLETVLRAVRDGRFTESPWRLFKHSYFRNESEEEAEAAMLAWGKRHGIEVSWRDGKTDVGPTVYDVRWLCLKVR